MEQDPDEIDIQLRSPAQVGRRMIALSAVCNLVGHSIGGADEELDDETDDDQPDDGSGERFDWLTWLTEERLVDALTPAERALLELSTDRQLLDELEDEGAAGEALGTLAWAVQRSDQTVLDRGYRYVDLLDIVPSPWDETAPFLAGLTLRPEDQIAAAREAAEILSWRAQVEVERRQSRGRNRAEIEEAIRDVAAEAASSGVAQVGADGDLIVGGESVRTLPDAIVQSMVAAARGRLRAMNWLCGLGDWDDPILTEI